MKIEDLNKFMSKVSESYSVAIKYDIPCVKRLIVVNNYRQAGLTPTEIQKQTGIKKYAVLYYSLLLENMSETDYEALTCLLREERD